MERYETPKRAAWRAGRRVETERLKWEKAEAAKWAEVDALAEVVVVKNKLTDENFGALVPWDGVDPGPQAF
ncbi:hypothetical protein [Rhodococcus sp. IEGM 1318]|uniref:hypothetical protein n=1 Tax=Rhodococcus sp. IEGM 1318 TaxID=3082226 RepID=UPI0029530A3C|nr:hypothetical protein [Rhodococcus sp. IEGM 1318]MDV8004046.1 hypothetical protein [Rhodococcus sp. IEGM 1318]